jgi:polysaccharide pyruvyl transferase WcaK-like protein
MSVPAGRLPDPVLVVGAYGYRNMGDEAILSGLLAKLGARSVTVVSRNPAETRRLHGVAAIGIGSAAAALRGHASVVIGGGGLFGRDMGRLGRLLPAYGLVAEGLGRTVVVEGVDVDERLPLSGRLLVPSLMRHAARVTVRDRRSAAIVERWGVPAHVAPDLSCWMPVADPERGRHLLRGAGVDLSRPVVGLALTAVQPTLADAVAAAACAAMDAVPEAQFCFIPMSRHPSLPAHDDMNLAARIRDARPRLAILDADPHPAAMLAAIAQLSAVVAMRYHAMLFAARMGVPLVPLVYAEKNVRWLDERGVRAQPAEPGPVTAALRTALAGDPRATSRLSPVAS